MKNPILILCGLIFLWFIGCTNCGAQYKSRIEIIENSRGALIVRDKQTGKEYLLPWHGGVIEITKNYN